MDTRIGYEEFLAGKAQNATGGSFGGVVLPSELFEFQAALVEWSLNMGRSGIFADCGLGKTAMQLAWADNVVRKTNKPVLIITPLAVAQQTVAEGEKFGIECRRGGKNGWKGIYVTNYQRLIHYESSDFAGAVCDESSILKSFDGSTRKAITEFMRPLQYRLLATATAAPNDYTELGTSSEALGHLGYTDMLGRFFTNKEKSIRGFRARRSNDTYTDASGWRFKGHAETAFWRWVSSWARALRKPSDIGFIDEGYDLPALIERQHVVETSQLRDGLLLNLPAVGLKEQREERRISINERCERVAELCAEHPDQSLIWCHLNKESETLTAMVDDAVQVTGSESDEAKEEKLLAFSSGQIRKLVTKPKIGAWGLNFQRCNHVTFFPSHSFEQYYQGVRRCWRFGQERPVTVDVITTKGDEGVLRNLQRKQKASNEMFDSLIKHMSDAMEIRATSYGSKKMEVPKWL